MLFQIALVERFSYDPVDEFLLTPDEKRQGQADHAVAPEIR